jgi:hypothetical protein
MKTMIGPKTAALLFAGLVALAVIKLKGTPLFIALIIILGLAAKSYVEYVRRRIE